MKQINKGRRKFIKTIGKSAIGLYLLNDSPFVDILSNQLVKTVVSDPIFYVIYPNSFINLKLHYINFNFNSGSLITKVEDPDKTGYLIVRIPQQHIAETYYDISKSECPSDSSVSKSFISSYSYILFETGNNDINVNNILDWSSFQIISHDDNDKTVGNYHHPIEKDKMFTDNPNKIPFTVFEIPYKMFLSPINSNNLKFVHNINEKVLFRIDEKEKKLYLYELWQSKLIIKENLAPPEFRIIGWSDKSDKIDDDKIIPNSERRMQLTNLSNLVDKDRQTNSESFKISSLGVTTNLEYNNKNPDKYELVKWRQEITLGRDNNAVVVGRAIDLKTGLKLLVSEITERRIENGRSFLIYRKKFEYLDPKLVYDDEKSFSNFPFKEIIPVFKGSYYNDYIIPETNKCIIPLKESEKCADTSTGAINPSKQDIIKMPYTLVDKNDVSINKNMELYIVLENDFNDKKKRDKILTEYDKFVSNKEETLDLAIFFDKEKVTYTKIPDGEDMVKSADNSTLKTEQMQFYSISLDPGSEKSYDMPFPILPRLKYALAYIPQLEGIDSNPLPQYLNYTKGYIEEKANPAKNISQTFLQILNRKKALESIADKVKLIPANLNDQFEAKYFEMKGKVEGIFSHNYDRIGGLVNPDLVIENISFLKNSLTFPENIIGEVQDKFKQINPLNFLKGFNAEILGGIELKKILQKLLPLEECPVFEIIDKAENDLDGIKQRIKDIQILSKLQIIIVKITETKKNLDQLQKEFDEKKNKLTKTPVDAASAYINKYINFIREWSKLNTIKTFIDNSNSNILEFEKKVIEDLKTKLNLKLNDIISDPNRNLESFFEKIKVILAGSNLLSSLDSFILEIQIKINNSTNATLNEKYYKLINVIKLKRSEIEKVIASHFEPINGSKGIEENCKDYLIKVMKTAKLQRDLYPIIKLMIKNHLFGLQMINKDYLKQNLSGASKEIIEGLDNFLTKDSLLPKDDVDVEKLQKELNEKLKVEKLNFTGLFNLLNKYKKDFDNYNQDFSKLMFDTVDEINSFLPDVVEQSITKVKAEVTYLKNQFDENLKIKVNDVKTNVDRFIAQASLTDTVEIYKTYLCRLRNINDNLKEANTVLSQLQGFQISLKDAESTIISEFEKWVKIKKEQGTNIFSEFEKVTQKTSIEKKIEALVNYFIQNMYLEDIKSLKDSLTIISKNIGEVLKSEMNKNENIKEIENEVSEKSKQIKKAKNDLLIEFNNYQNEVKEAFDNIRKRINEYYDELKSATDQVVKEIKDKIDIFEYLYSLLKGSVNLEYSYNWNTNKFEEADLGFVKFLKGSNATELKVDVKTKVEINTTKDGKFNPGLKSITSTANTELIDFGINFFRIITVYFSRIKLETGTKNTNIDIKISHVEFDGPLNFVKAFQSVLSTLDKGIKFDFGKEGVLIGYEFPIPNIIGGGFNFVNIKIGIRLILPLKAGIPAKVELGLNTPQDLFLITAGIYGGSGCFVAGLETKAGQKSLVLIMEFGAVLYANFSIGEGYVKLFAGIYLSRQPNSVEIRAYIICSGFVTILNGFVEISIIYYMGLIGNGSYLEGLVSISVSVKISVFFKFKKTFTVIKRIHGTSSNTSSPMAGGISSKHKVNQIDTTDLPGTSTLSVNTNSPNKVWEKYINTYYYVN